MKKNIAFDKGIIFLILILIIIAGTVFFFVSRIGTDKVTSALEEDGVLTAAFLISGRDDQLLATEIFFYDSATKKGALLDIPGNTGDVIESLQRVDEISVLFRKDRPEAYIQKLEKIIDMPIPFYFSMNLEQVVPLVDLNEGLELFIANPVERPEEMIFLPSGSVILDGDKAVDYLTYSDPGEQELERAERRGKFIQGLLKGWGSRSESLQKPQALSRISQNLKTNLTQPALASFIREIRSLNQERIVFQRVLGTVREVDGKSLLFRHRDGLLLKETVRQTVRSLANLEVLTDQELQVTLEILNGTTNTGLANRTGQLFQNYGYEILRVGNYDNFDQEYTVIIGRTEDSTRVQRAANLIRCTRIEMQPPEEYPAGTSGPDQPEITIILGKDFDGQYVK